MKLGRMKEHCNAVRCCLHLLLSFSQLVNETASSMTSLSRPPIKSLPTHISLPLHTDPFPTNHTLSLELCQFCWALTFAWRNAAWKERKIKGSLELKLRVSIIHTHYLITEGRCTTVSNSFQFLTTMLLQSVVVSKCLFSEAKLPQKYIP